MSNRIASDRVPPPRDWSNRSVGDSEVVERGLAVILCWRALKDRITHQVLGNDVCVVICNNNLYNASNKY